MSDASLLPNFDKLQACEIEYIARLLSATTVTRNRKIIPKKTQPDLLTQRFKNESRETSPVTMMRQKARMYG